VIVVNLQSDKVRESEGEESERLTSCKGERREREEERERGGERERRREREREKGERETYPLSQ
jgi:hypothetical protein